MHDLGAMLPIYSSLTCAWTENPQGAFTPSPPKILLLPFVYRKLPAIKSHAGKDMFSSVLVSPTAHQNKTKKLLHFLTSLPVLVSEDKKLSLPQAQV